jgi:putative glycosyltransferase
MKKSISFVTSLYYSSKYINDFYLEHKSIAEALNLSYEFIFVNDGYTDNSVDLVKEIIASDTNVKLIVLSRNFGQYPAMFAGMAHATAELIYTNDADLEEDPKNLYEMYNQMKNDEDIDVVYAVIKERTGGLIRGYFGKLFFNFLDYLSDIKIDRNQGWQRLQTYNYVQSLLLYKEAETFPAGLMALSGYNQKPFLIEKNYKGSTVYTFKKRLQFAFNSLIAFSSKPLVIISVIGAIISFISLLALVLVVVNKLCNTSYQSGWVSIIVSIWFVGGLILTSVGIIGIYLAKVFNQIKNRPLYIIKKII